MIENVSTQLTVFHYFAHCLLPGRAFASLYALLFLEKEAEIGGREIMDQQMILDIRNFCLFVCFNALRPKSTAMVMAGRSVHLTTLFFWAGLNKRLTSNSCTYFRL